MAKKEGNEPIEVDVITNEKPYVLYDLQAKHLFLLTRVIGKLEIKKLADIFKGGVDFAATEQATDTNELARTVGYATIIEIAGIIMESLPNCQDELFKFLAAISNLTEKQIASLPLADFADMVIDVITKDDFSDFFTRCARFIK